jgi:hypothetical protein
MKILKNFDAKKIAKAKNKILLAIVSVLFLILLVLFSAFREFVSKHPGLIGVLIAVSGEVYFDWKEESGRHAKWKKFFMALLVVSLAYELYEASESDQKAAESIELAGKANERAALVESNNVALEAEIQPRRITPEQKDAIRRELNEWRFIRDKCEVHITVEGYDTEARIFADQIGNLLGENFRVFTDEGINATPPPGFGTKFSTHDPPSPSAKSIARSLKRLPIEPIQLEISTNIPVGTLNIQVWPKPLE